MSNQQVIVQKYGGMCLETPEKVRLAANQVARLHNSGHRLVVVVSAMGKTTDQLIQLAYQTSPSPNRRELDMLLTTGERVSMSLMSMALTDLKIPAISFTGSQAGVLTDESHSSARIVDVRPIRVREELNRGRVVVLAGFQGVNPMSKEITTLGRGGSDTTAVAMAGALRADRCEIIKEVDGVCTADPRIVSGAKTLHRLSFSALADMCYWGAKVLHFRSVELAMSQNVPLFIKKWESDQDSTQVLNEVNDMEIGKILSVNSLQRVEHLAIDANSLNNGFEIFAAHLKQNGLSWPQLLASAFEAGQCRLMLTADNESLDTLLRTLTLTRGVKKLCDTMACVSLTCHGGVGSELPYRALQVLSQQGLVPQKYIFSSHSLSLFLPPDQREKAIQALHALI